MSNAINPEHYNRLNPQPKDVIRAWGLNFNLGSAVKYISRAGHKDGAGGVDTVVGLIKTSERRQSIRSVRGGVEHGSRIIKAGIYSLYHSGSRIIGSRYSLV